jgi:prephenate dehydrogenase
MAMETFIIGLGDTGASISLAMSKSGANVASTGYDPNAQRAREARKRGDIDRIVFTPRKASQAADVIFLSVSPDMVKEHLEIIGPTLKKGAVVFDMSPLKSTSLSWAGETLREGCFYVGAVPVVNPEFLGDNESGTVLPSADMFRDGLLALVIPPNTPENVVELTYAIANILGANPLFIDPAEIDAITATIKQIPALIGIIQLHLGLHSPMWREIQRMAGRDWSKSTTIGASYNSTELTESIKLNRQNVIYRLDSMLEELEQVRALLAKEDDEALLKYIQESSGAYHAWISDRKSGKLSGPELKVPQVEKPNVLDRLLGTGRKRGRKR